MSTKYNLRNTGVSSIIARNFPNYVNQASVIALEGVLSLVPDEQGRELSNVYVYRKGNRVKMEFHNLGEDGTEKICANVGLKEKADHLSIFEGNDGDFSFFKKFTPS